MYEIGTVSTLLHLEKVLESKPDRPPCKMGERRSVGSSRDQFAECACYPRDILP